MTKCGLKLLTRHTITKFQRDKNSLRYFKLTCYIKINFKALSYFKFNQSS